MTKEKDINDVMATITTHMIDFCEVHGDQWENEYFLQLYRLHGHGGFYEIACNIQNDFPQMRKWFDDRQKEL